MPFPLSPPQSLPLEVGEWVLGAQASQGDHGVSPGDSVCGLRSVHSPFLFAACLGLSLALAASVRGNRRMWELAGCHTGESAVRWKGSRDWNQEIKYSNPSLQQISWEYQCISFFHFK